jgi:predicted F0F1-ATPase subunit
VQKKLKEKNGNSLKEIQEESSRVLREVSPLLTMGWQLVLTILLTSALGWWLDKEFNTSPVWILILSIFGIVVGMIYFIKTALNFDKKREENEKKAKEKKNAEDSEKI